MLSCRGVVAAAVDLVSDVATNDVSRSLARFELFFFCCWLVFCNFSDSSYKKKHLIFQFNLHLLSIFIIIFFLNFDILNLINALPMGTLSLVFSC